MAAYPGLVGAGLALLALLALSLLAVLPAPFAASRTVEPLQVARRSACTGTLELRRAVGWLPVEVTAGEPVGDDRVTVPVPAEGVGTATVRYPIPTTRRGVLPVGPLELRRRGVGGLAERTARVGDQVHVEVLPRTLPLRGLPRGVRRGQVGADERAEHGGTDLVGLHEYVPGDDLRRLHWATSARTGTLMVRDDADPSHPHVVVVLDDRADAYVDPDDLEEAVDLVASLVAAAGDAGHPVHLRSVSGAIDLRSDGAAEGRVDRQAAALRAALTTVGPAPDVAALAPLAVRDLDVAVLVTGAGRRVDDLLLEAGRASYGVLLHVDPAPARTVEVVGRVTRLRGPRAEDLVGAWDATVAVGR
ncbi:DUF58 domain-containing protein [Nitriliruptoraceae bacterium ZYF776]|nr:DUF58 domain-containing protein [Profundirhabdus halotolerans]